MYGSCDLHAHLNVYRKKSFAIDVVREELVLAIYFFFLLVVKGGIESNGDK
jgi:hypothetical protein